MSKKRLAEILVERGLAEDAREAVALAMAGAVWVNGVRVDKPGTRIGADSLIRLRPRTRKFVSRGGLKLESALDDLGLSVQGQVCLDVGVSTGGFTDCLLQRGAVRVYALDVGKGLLDWKLRRDARVVLLEGINARHLQPDQLPEPPDLVTVDVSFISLRKILPRLHGLKRARILTLVKPQFEAERGEVGRGGVIRSAQLREQIVGRLRGFVRQRGFRLLAEVASALPGQKGNQEVFLLLQAQ